MPRPRLAVLASGTGTLLEAILASGLPVDVVAVDRPCRAADIARAAGVDVVEQLRTDFSSSFDRTAYGQALAAALQARGVEVVAMAGFGTVVPALTTALPGRVLNAHPSLLPAFKGWHPVRDALERGVKVTGCTVHVATDELDEGEILAQEAVRVLPGDDEAALHERIKGVERRLYPATIASFLAAVEDGSRRPGG